MTNEFGPYRDAYTPESVIAVKGCCIRMYETGPEIHANQAHISTGIRSVCIEETTGFLRVDHDGSAPVVSIHVDLDETLSQREITVGASGGTNYTRLVFSHWHVGQLDLRIPEHYAITAGKNANLWYSVLHMIDRGGDG